MNSHAEMKSPRRRLILLSIAVLLVGALYLVLSHLGDSPANPVDPAASGGPAVYRDLAEHPEKHKGEEITTEGDLLALLRLEGEALYEAELYDPKTDEKYLCRFSTAPLHFRPRERVAFIGTFDGIGEKTSRAGRKIRAPLLVGKALRHLEPPAPAQAIRRADLPPGTEVTEKLFHAAKAATLKEEPAEAETAYYDFVLFPTKHRGETFRLRGEVAEIHETKLGDTTVHKITLVSRNAAPAIAYTDRLPPGLARGDAAEMEGVFIARDSFVNQHDVTLHVPAFVARPVPAFGGAPVSRRPVDSGAVKPLDAGLWLALAVALAILYLFLRRRLTRGNERE